MEKVLEINNLSKYYGKLIAVRDISLKVERGQVYGILGPNGSGKTTTLGVILGVLNPNKGSYYWFDNEDETKSRRRIGALMETPNFYPYLTLAENLTIATRIKGISENEINRVLGITNLLTRKHSKFGTLSLGMKQRMSIASVLLGDPEILVLDEPTNGLDPEGFAEVREIIMDQAKAGKTILLASHILDEVEKVCSHVAILKSGEIIADGKVGELLSADDLITVSSKNPNDLYITLDRSHIIKKISRSANEITVSLNKDYYAEDLNKLAFENGHVLSKIEIRKPSLETQFLELVK